MSGFGNCPPLAGADDFLGESVSPAGITRQELIETVRGRGYRYVLMAPGGIEPPRAASKAAALSAELRGLTAEG